MRSLKSCKLSPVQMRWDAKLVLTAAWAVAGVASYLVVPYVAPFILPLTVVAPIFWYPQKLGLIRHLLARSLLARLLAVASAYLLINAGWSTAPVLAYIGVATFFIGGVTLHIVVCTLPFLSRAPVRAMSIGLYVGYVVCALLISIEIVFDHPLHLYFFSLFPELTPKMDHLIIESSVVKGLPSYYLNRHIAALLLLIWPVLLVANRLASSTGSRAALMTCLLPVVPAVFMSAHETSKLAAVGAVAVFFVQMLAGRFVKPLFVAAWTIACVAVVPLAAAAYNNLHLHKATWLQYSARDRIVIWGVTSAKIAEAPLLGHGMVSTRELGLEAQKNPAFTPDKEFMLTTGPHAHNAYLQIWFETGLVGALLLLLIGFFALHTISRAAADIQPWLYAAFANNALLAASSFSIWSRWFLASYFFSVIFIVLASKFAADARQS